MTTEQLRREWKRIMLDIEELAESNSLELDAREDLEEVLEIMERWERSLYSTDL